MKFLLAFVVAALGSIVAGCSTVNTPTSQPSFTSATRWTYALDSLDASGTSTFHDTIDVTLAATGFFNGIKLDTLSDGSIATLTNDGDNYTLNRMSVITELCGAEFGVPATAGDTLTTLSIPMKVNGALVQGRIVVYVKSVNVSITVPAGTFVCDKFAMAITSPTSGLMDWYYCYVSPKVGVVEKDYFRPDPATSKPNEYLRVQLIGMR